MTDRIWTQIPLSKLAGLHYKIAISIKDLVNQSNDFSKKYVGGCTPTLIKSEPKKLFMQYRVVCKKADSDPRGHEVRIQFDISKVTTTSNINNLDVKCSCSCPAYLYWGAQWNSHQQDALEGPARPLLQAPTEQLDKRNGYMVCKHIHVVAKRIAPAISNVVNRIKERLILERLHQTQEEEIEAQQEEIKKMQETKAKPPAKAKPPVKPKPKKPSVEHKDMGQSRPTRSRPGVLD